MTKFLEFIGIIALFIIGKFIYDTFFTDRTEKNWNQYKQSNPEDAARIERNRGLDLSTKSKSREQDKRDSLLRMAVNMCCSPAQVRDNFIKELKEQQLTAALTKEAIQMLRQKKYEESEVFNIDPDDTGAAYMEEWTKEYSNNKGYAYRKRTVREVTEDWMTENQELDRIVKSREKSELHDFLFDNPDLMHSMLTDTVFADRPAEKYRQKAIDKFTDKDYTGAIQLINKGLEFDEPETEPFLFKLRAECKGKLSFAQLGALNDMNKAIKSILKNMPDRYFSISDFLEKRGEIKQELGDTLGATQDKKKAAGYYAKYEANKTDDDDDDGFPF